MRPPGIRELLDDPIYRDYMRHVPALPVNLQSGQPWAVWARTTDSPAQWRGARFHTYMEAWSALVKVVRNTERYSDGALISRRLFFAPPPGFTIPWAFEWCQLCRRPTRYSIRPDHHALRRAPVLTDDEPHRCFYDGSRRVFSASRHQ